MTQVRLALSAPTSDGTGRRPTGTVEWRPTKRRNVTGDVVLPAPFTVGVGATTPPVITVAPTEAGWAWAVVERVQGGSPHKRLVVVPDSVSVLNYADLVEVDPATLDPVTLSSAWWTQVTAYAQPIGDYATNAALTTGLAGKVDTATLGATVAADATVKAAFGLKQVIGQLEGQAMWVTGHSWQAASGNATTGARWHERLAGRLRVAGTPTNQANSGRTIGDMSTAALGGSTAWAPRTKAFAAAICSINDLTLFQGTAAARRGYQYAWRALLSQFTANAAIAANTAAFAYSSGWTAETPGTSSAQAAGINTTGGTRYKTTAAGSYFEVNVNGDGVDVFLVARAAGAGLCTFTVGGSTVATLDLTLATAQDTPAAARIRGLGAGTHTVRGTLTSGVSLTVDSIRIPSPAPTLGLIMGEPPLAAGGMNYAGYAADLVTYKADLATIVADYPTFVYVDLAGTGWDSATMLIEDGKHPNDRGCAYIADRAQAALPNLPWSAGLDTLTTTGVPAYSQPANPTIPTGGQDGTGAGPAGAVPGQVTGLVLTPGNTQIGASWAAPSGTPTDYIIQYRVTGSGSWSTFADGTSATTSAVITGLTNGSSYDVQVAAVNASGTGAFSATQTATPAAPGTPTITDSFTKADGALAGTTTSTGSKTWSLNGTAIPGVVSGVVKVTSGTGNSYITVDTGNAQGDVQAKLVAQSGTVGTMISGLTLRMIDANNQLTVSLRKDANTGGDVYALLKRVAGGATAFAWSTVKPVNGDIVKAEMRGSTVRVLVNGVEVIPATDPTSATNFSTATVHGLYFNGSDTVSTWDDWSYTPYP